MVGAAKHARSLRERIVERWRFGLVMLEALSQLHRFTGLLIHPYAVFVDELDSQEEARASITDIEYRALGPEDVPAMLRFPRPGDPSMLDRRSAARLEHSLGYGAFVGGALIGYCGADRRECRTPVASAALIELCPDEASGYDFYVLPEFRGRKIGARLWQMPCDELAREGRRRSYRVVSVLNASSMRLTAKSRARRLETRLLLGFPEHLAWDLRLRAHAPDVPTKRLILITTARVKARRRQPWACVEDGRAGRGIG